MNAGEARPLYFPFILEVRTFLEEASRFLVAQRRRDEGVDGGVLNSAVCAPQILHPHCRSDAA